jgi:DNA-binding FadR family transcriptional regulator
MPNTTVYPESLSSFLKHLAAAKGRNQQRLSPLKSLSAELGISVASLREQLEVARALGFVEIHPKKGIRLVDYSFESTLRQSLAYAVAVDANYFQQYADLRTHLERAYWFQAVELLNQADRHNLQELVAQAFAKLHRQPPQIPHREHRQLHLSIYGRLNNAFVTGLLEAYWDLYETFGLDVYTDFSYLEQVWNYHQKVVDAIASENFTLGYEIMQDHMKLLYKRTAPASSAYRHHFE